MKKMEYLCSSNLEARLEFCANSCKPYMLPKRNPIFVKMFPEYNPFFHEKMKD